MASKAKPLYTSKSATDALDGPIGRKTSGSVGSKPGKSFGLKFKKGSSSKIEVYDSSPPALRSGNHSRELSPQPVMASKRTPEPERSVSPENFFDFSASNDVDIWGDDITAQLKKSTLRKMSLIKEEGTLTTPLQEDENVQNIGTAFVGADVDETRRSKSPPVVKQDVPDVVFSRARRATSPPSLYDYMKTKMSKSKPGSAIQEVPKRARLKTDADLPTNSLPIHVDRPLSSHEPTSLDKIVQLEKKIEDLKSACWKAPNVHETIDHILVGMPYCLEWYKSHFEKIALLDAAIATNDGNCIMAVLLFLRKSVNQPILLGMLQKRPIALGHYASYLKQLKGTTELINLYKRLNENERLADLKIQQCEAVMNPSERCSKIKECHTLFTTSPELKADARHLEDYARLTQKQRMIMESEGVPRNRPSLLFRSMVTTLLYCCRYHRDKAESNTANPVALRREFNIAEKQYFQMYLLALCLDDDWNAIEILVTTKGFFSKKKKSPIGFERVVKTIARKSMKPSPQILTKYLAEVDDLELRLQLATEVGVYDVGLDCLKQLKDRERVRGYINVIPVRKQPEYRRKIESLLANSHIKWKNF